MEYLKRFENFVSEIRAGNSRLYKLGVLANYRDDVVIQSLLKFVFDPYITTGLSVKKLAKDVKPLDDWTDITSLEMLNYIAEFENTGSDRAIAIVKTFEQKLDKPLVELLERIISKNLPLGVNVLTINKVMPGLIRTFNIMLANKYFDKPEIVEGKEFTLTTKIDGGRIIAIKDRGVVKFYTRAGQEYEGLVDLEKEMYEKMPDGIALDGEITLLDTEGLDNKEQYKMTMMITRKLGEKHGVKMKVFDIMTAEEFISQDCLLTYKQRRSMLDSIFSGKFGSFDYFQELPILYQGSDSSMIMKVLDSEIAKGEEGIMININDAKYEFTRTSALLKVKKMKDLDLTVVALEEGTNQNAGKLGAFVVEYKGCKVRVGSGISKELREKIWANKDEYIGLTIIVQYFEETTNQAGGVSLRFPVFLDFRYDK